MSVIEQELITAASFEPRRNYERQDYLAALARAINEMNEDEFDNLSIEAQDWFNEAVRALNKKKDLPEFPDASTENSEDDEDDTPDEADEEEPLEAAVEDDEAEEVAEEKPAKAKRGKKASVKVAKPERRRKGQAPRKLEHPPITEITADTKPEDLDIVFDDYGIVKGTKNAAAAAMLTQGCRMGDITETIGGTYYNLIQRLVKQGHVFEKSANGLLKLTPVDKLTGKVVKAKGKK